MDDFTEIKGVGETVADKLIVAGYTDYMSIAIATPAELAVDCDIGPALATKIVDEARRRADVGDLRSGTEILESYEKQTKEGDFHLSTGSKALDAILGGGIERGVITEVFAEYGSGKTQLALQASVNVALDRKAGGMEGEVIYIDSEETFRIDRIIEMIKARGGKIAETLSRIHVARAFSSVHQIFLGDQLKKIAKDRDVKLVVVDSLTSHFRAEYIGRGQLSARQQMLNRHMHDIKKFAISKNAFALVTNQVYSRPDMYGMAGGNAVGGNIVGHTSAFRLSFRKATGEKRIAKLIDSPNLPVAEATFRVTSEGIRDE